MILSVWPHLAATAFLLAFTQSTPVNTPSCQPKTQTLANGAVVSIQAAGGNSPEQACEVLVRDRTGRTVFSDRAFGAQIHPATGRDIDNDGRPDAVLGVDAGGPNRCCWEYPVISFNPAPRVLLKLPPAAMDFDTLPGKTLIWITAAFPELGPDAADSPTVETVREFRPTGFVDVTPDYCKRMLAGELRGPGDLRRLLNALTLRSKQASRTDTGSPFDREQTRIAAQSMALQHVYCGQIETASDLVLEVWPASEQSVIRRRLKDAVNSRWPDLAKKLTTW
jgi:hypothetical protein